MALSVVDPINSAIERAKRVCFRPFDLGKWFTIGFCAFLAGLAEGGSTIPTNFNASGGPGGPPNGRKLAEGFREAIDWVQAHLTPILVIGLIVLSVVLALMALVNWLGSRGQFMFIDNIVHNRGAVAAPWREYRKEGNSLFRFRFLFSLAVLGVFFAIPIGAILIALPDIQAEKFGSAAAIGLAVGIGGLLVWSIVSALANLFLNDFVVPIMYLRRISVLEAWNEFGTSMLAGHIGVFVLYVLFKIVLAFGVGFLTVLIGCCTLCIGFIPYLGSHVLLLPLHVFWRSYSLSFIEQFGPEWRIFSMADERFAELVDEQEWPDERFRPEDEDFREPDDRIRPG